MNRSQMARARAKKKKSSSQILKEKRLREHQTLEFLPRESMKSRKVVYDGKLYNSKVEKGRIILVPEKGSLKKLRKKDITNKPHMISISQELYNQLKSETKKGYHEIAGEVQGLQIRAAGVVKGEFEPVFTGVKEVKRIPKEKMKSDKKHIVPTAGTLLNKEIEEHVKDKGTVGFFHSHPTRDKLSPADKKEIREMGKRDVLKDKSKIHIVTRSKGILPVSISKKARPMEPLAYYRDNTGKIHKIPIVIKKKWK